MKLIKLAVSLVFIICILYAKSQVNVKDSAIATPMISVSYAVQVPGGDLAQRFGWNSAIGGAFSYKTKGNWYYSVDGNFLFGDKLKEKQILNNISTEKGEIIDMNGEYASVMLYERGMNFSVKFGKVFSVLAINPNSGFFITGGAGFLQHKIRIEDIGNRVAQLKGDYKKGYDRLSNGWMLTESFGYQYLGNRRLINFFGSIDFYQAFTQSRRDYNFDTQSKDETKRNDYLIGCRVGWIFPLYSRAPQDYYYY